jgi:hypothetical protein
MMISAPPAPHIHGSRSSGRVVVSDRAKERLPERPRAEACLDDGGASQKYAKHSEQQI